MLTKYGDGQITHVIKTSEDLEAEKQLAKEAKEELDKQMKTAKETKCS
jgi:hypothetical protein